MRPGRLRGLPATPPSSRRAWWVSFGLLFALFALWSLASPLGSAPDEGAHIVEAAAVARGQLGGTDTVTPKGVLTEVEVPELYARSAAPEQVCYSFRPRVTAGCAPALVGSDRPTRVRTNFGHYPPLPYLLYGLPSLLPASVVAIRLMRLAGALVCAALVASGLASAASGGKGLTVAGTLLAVTPTAAFLAGTVNTSGLEVAAAIALWPSLLALADRGREASTRLVVRAAVAAGTLAVVRPISPVWLGLILVLVAAAVGRDTVRSVARDPRVVRAAVVVAGVAALSVVWVVVSGSLTNIGGGGQSHGVLRDFARSSGKFEFLLRQMVSVQGWLDTLPPAALLYSWLAAAGALVLLGLVVARRRGVLALVATGLLMYAIPVVIETARAGESGFPWQGRYTLPLAVGLPILAGWLVDASPVALDVVRRRLGRVVIGVACAAQLMAHVWSTRRYMVGVFEGRLNYLFADGWRPPVPAWLLLPAFAAVAAGLAVWADRLAFPRLESSGARPTSTAASRAAAVTASDGRRTGSR